MAVALLSVMTAPNVTGFFDPETATVTYVVHDPTTRDAVIIDPVLAYDALRSQTDTSPADVVLQFVSGHELCVRAILETHAHADHMSAARYLADHWKVPVAIGSRITEVQGAFVEILGLDGGVKVDGSQFDQLLHAGETYAFGSLPVRALSTPGHTPACLSYLIGDAVFTGDALFMDDFGTGRTDFPAGSAEALYRSVTQELYQLPDETRVFVGHDYQPGGRPVRFESTVGSQKASNPQLNSTTSQSDFVALRTKRDAELAPPRLIFPSIQVNVFGGYLPDEESNGRRYLKIPLNYRRHTTKTGALKGAS